MFTPESGSQPNFDRDRIIAYLNPEDPEDAEIIASMEEARQECRAQFPTVESAVAAYRDGLISYSWLQAGYTKEEVKPFLEGVDNFCC